jgi:hypothetical protein
MGAAPPAEITLVPGAAIPKVPPVMVISVIFSSAAWSVPTPKTAASAVVQIILLSFIAYSSRNRYKVFQAKAVDPQRFG